MANILIAEDDALSQRFVGTIAERMGHKVFPCVDGQEAWEVLCARKCFDLVITDIMMPRMDGTTLIQNIRADERFAAIPIVIMSAFMGVKDIAGLLEIGATWFIPKPVDRATLEDYINRAVK